MTSMMDGYLITVAALMAINSIMYPRELLEILILHDVTGQERIIASILWASLVTIVIRAVSLCN